MKKTIIILTTIIITAGCSSISQKETVTKISTKEEIKSSEKKVFMRNTTFEYENNEGAKEVYLIGEMTDWEKNKVKFNKTSKTKWALNKMIAPGKYEYKFIVDGKDVVDDKSEVLEINAKGEKVSFVVVEPEDLTVKYNPDIPHGQVEKITHNSKILGQEISYNIYLPPSYNKNVKTPLLVLLHGYDMDSNQWTDGGIQIYMDNLINDKRIKPFAILMPSAGSSFYQGSSEDYIINELMPMAAEKYNFDISRERCAVAGMSMGGYGAFYLGVRHSDRFAITVPISMGMDGAMLDVFLTEAEREMEKSKDKINMSMYCGKDDSWDLGNGIVLKVLNNKAAERLNKNANITFKYTTDKGGHDFSYWGKAAKNYLKDISDVICK